MKKIIINGPSKLKGKVKVQGAKNAAMKHVVIPLLTNDVFEIHNVPKIGTTKKLLELIKLQEAKIKWKRGNTITIDTHKITKGRKIPANIFFYTSGGVLTIPILASKYNKCTIEKDPKRSDYGGDQIGSRALDHIIKTLECLGIKYKETRKEHTFSRTSDRPFVYKIPVKSFSASVIATFCALFKEGTSKIITPTEEAEFDDILEFLKKAGAEIKSQGNQLIVKGGTKLKGIEYTTMNDRQDFATWVSAALTTNSEIEITNIDYKKMRLEQMNDVLNKMNISLYYSQDSCLVPAQIEKIKPTKIFAGKYPDFQTEWQVLFSPLLTQIKGKSRVVEKIFPNRMQHWRELGELGAKYKFVKSAILPEYPHTGPEKRPPNAVEVTGPVSLKGAKVEAQDVRGGAALIIAGLAAQGKTEISNIDHIERGYEDIVGRLRAVGADIAITD